MKTQHLKVCAEIKSQIFVSRRTAILILATTLICGCGKGWQMDYGKPAAQFLEKDVAVKATPFEGKKITIKGSITKIDTTIPGAAWIYLGDGIRCNLGKFAAMASSTTTGEVVYVDGFLKHIKENDILIQPAMLRDPTAPFQPL